MATAVVMPKQGQTVESCIIVNWKKAVGEPVAPGEILCEVETDKALLEVESPAAGLMLAQFFGPGDEVPVLTNIAVIGEPGEKWDDLLPEGAQAAEAAPAPESPGGAPAETAAPVAEGTPGQVLTGVSPRARKLARQREIDVAGLDGSGPYGRIIERDVMAAARKPVMSPLARTMAAAGGFVVPGQGSGVSGRIMAGDLTTAAPARPEPQAARPPEARPAAGPDEVRVIPLKGIRKVIAGRMLESLQTTAQLTLNASADARAMLEYRKRLKNSAEAWGLQKVTINDLVLLAVARILPHHPDLNALFNGEAVHQYRDVHLAFAVDTPRGLMVPVIRQANSLSLKAIAAEAKRLAAACQGGTVLPDELTGGTFTVTNLGSFGVESFTPILNPPQVAILGVNSINPKPVEVDDEIHFIPHLGLSLTINHQVVDGAPAARFLQALAQGLAGLDLLLAL